MAAVPNSNPQHSRGWAARASARRASRTALVTAIAIAHAPSMSAPRRIEGMIGVGGRLDKALAEASGLSRERIKALIADGAVLVDDRAAASGSAKVDGGACFAITLPPTAPLEALPQDIPLVIAFEDDYLIV